MLSMAAIPGAQDAASYYFKDENSYTAEEGGQQAEWHGRGAASLGLEGAVTQSAFAQMLKGELPNGDRLGRMVEGEWKHFPGVDLTFSAPKSLSLLAYIGGDTRLLEANRQAVKSTLDWVEKNMLVTRVKEQGEVSQVRTNSLVAAMFPHSTSRTFDPQAHIHAIVMNVTERPDGTWASVHNPPLWQDSMLIGRIYRSFLAGNVQALGYDITMKHRDGRFEINGVDGTAIDEFSGRSKQIDTLFSSFTHQNTKTRDIAAVMSRSHKGAMNWNSLLDEWHGRAGAINFSPEKIVDTSIERLSEKESVQPTKALDDIFTSKPSLMDRIKDFFVRSREDEKVTTDPYALWDRDAPDDRIRNRSAVSYALRVLSEREASFRENDIRSEALNVRIKGLDITGVDAEIEALKQEGLILDGQGKYADMVTTRQALDLEQATIGQLRTAQAGGKPFFSHTDANAAIAHHDLNDRQADAGVAILSSSSRVIGVQGYAGTGKTRMLRSVADILEGAGKTFMGFAPTNSAREVLREETGVQAETIQYFLKQYDGVAKDRATPKGLATMREDYKDTTLVVDEASMLSSRQMHDLLKISNQLDIPKLVLVGDTKQLAAIEAGKPFKALQEQGMETQTLDILLRQKDENLKGAVQDIIDDRVVDSFDRLRDTIIEVPQDGQDKETGQSLSEAVVDLWTSKSEEVREGTLVIAASNRLRKEMNEGIRQQLKSEGRITGPEMVQSILENRHLTREENRYAATYDEENRVMFHRDVPSLEIENGSLWTVTKVDDEKETLHLKGREGNEQLFRPDLIPADEDRNFLSVFEQTEITLGAGDKVRWTSNDKEQGVINGQTATLVSITDETITMKMKDGEERAFDRTDPILHHLDHGYALTAYASQGTTFDRVIAVLDSSEKMLTNRQTFYVEISRAREHVDLVVDSKQNVMDELTQRGGEKTSALETLFPGDEGYRGPLTEREQEVGHELPGPGAEQQDEAEFILDMI